MNKLIKIYEQNNWVEVEYHIDENGFRFFMFMGHNNSTIYYCDIGYNSLRKCLVLYGLFYSIYKSMGRKEKKEFLEYMEGRFGIIITGTDGGGMMGK